MGRTVIRTRSNTISAVPNGLRQQQELALERCPHCSTAAPRLSTAMTCQTNNYNSTFERRWVGYKCATCGGVVLTAIHPGKGDHVKEMYPMRRTVSDSLPDRACEYLKQATESPPAGAVMLAASAVDAMLKEKGYKDGSLYKRIKAAKEDHLITGEMELWAHEVRLDANEQRHSDNETPLPTPIEASRALEFAGALGEFLFRLPAMVEQGRRNAAEAEEAG